MSTPKLERLAKWRTVFTGWIIGTASKEMPGVRGVVDLMERTIILRAEISALTTMLRNKGVFTHAEFVTALEAEAAQLDSDFARLFPGYTATDHGINIDVKTARETNARLGFPQ